MKEFNYALTADPGYFRDGRLDAHSDHSYYASAQEMEEENSSFKKILNGVWKFHYARNYDSAVHGFEKEEYDCHDWDDIYVPAHIQMEGWDHPQYVNVQYPWEGSEEARPGEIPQKFNPVASYVKYFEVPENMKGRRLFISFQGAESGLAVWLNGHFVGYSEDSFTPSEFELTDYVKEGENKLAAQVFKWTSSSWCEDQDFFRFSGIYRDVYLYTVPDVHVRDLRIRAIPDASLKSADFELQFETWGTGTADLVLSCNGETVVKETVTLGGKDTYSWKVEEPKLWSAENPQLYDLLITVKDQNGNVTEYIPEKVGFRRFEMDGNIMKINGKRIVFHGVNRHEFSSLRGRIVSMDELRKDLTVMKQNNINAVRTCHYPDNSPIYRLCDEFGLYMIAETNLESHGTWDTADATKDYDFIVPASKPEWKDMMLDRANSMYQLDKNHPSIVIWSCGNEAYGGKDIYEMSEFFHKEDPTRLVHYEGIFHDRTYNSTSDMESQMYTPVKKIREFLKEHRDKPFICCEYTHAMGNSCGGMHLYTDLSNEEPLYQGGFIWDYIDQTITKKDRYGHPYQAYGGDFDDRPSDFSFSADGIVYGGDREPSPKMQEVKFNYQSITAEISDTEVHIINRNLFTPTSFYDCTVTVARNGKEIRSAELATDVAPLSEKTYTLPFAVETVPGEYTITVSFTLKKKEVWAPAGHEVAFGQHVYQVEGKKECHQGRLTVIHSKHCLGVKGENFHVIFSPADGGMISYKYAGREMLEEAPKPNFWRAPNDNDKGSLMMGRYAQWKIASLYASVKDFRCNPYAALIPPVIEEKEHSVLVTFHFVMPTSPVSECEISYEVYGDGTVRTVLSYDPVKELKDMPEFGVLFRMNADYDHVTWYGLGPEETYHDRMRGGKLGIYHNLVKDNVAKYIVPQECGAKEGVRWAEVTDSLGRGMRFAMDNETGPMLFSALPYTPHEMEEARHPFDLPEVHHTVVRAALDQMGVGGDDSWGACTHEEDLLNTDHKMVFAFSFRGI